MTLAGDLATDLAAAVDPVAFARRCGLPPDPWQADVLGSTASQMLLNCCRQSGKSTVAAVLAAHTAAYRPGTTSLLVAPSQRQSIEVMGKVRALLHHVERPVQESESRIRLCNDSRVLAMPGGEGGHSIRGYSVHLLIIDEAARVDEEVYAAVRPALAATGGRLIAMSTPHGQRGWWAEAWHDGGTNWRRVRVAAAKVPRISPAFLAQERAALGHAAFAQEYEGEFTSATGAVFSADAIAAAFGGRVFA